jgi:predicted ATPase
MRQSVQVVRLRARSLVSLGAEASPRVRYDALLACGTLVADAPQTQAVRALEELHDRLQRGLPLRGLYLYGGPGRGKTALATLLQHRAVRQVHSHQFFLDLHRRLHRLRGDLPALSAELASEARVLSLDELDVTDIADALVLRRLLGELQRRGVALVATSNRPPEALYAGGLNVGLFQPAFGQTVRASSDVLCLDGGADYRLSTRSERYRTLQLFVPSRCADALWLAVQCAYGETASCERRIPVFGAARQVVAPIACGRACRFTFSQLCGAQACTSAADFCALADAFDIIQLDNVPVLGADEDALRRFVILVDILYERRKMLALGACGWSSVAELFAVCAVTQGPAREPSALRVLGVGGASGRSTTMMAPTVEWSATGLHGRSLADLGSGRFTSLAVPRCASRIHEMSRFQWAGHLIDLLPHGPSALPALVAALQEGYR